MVLQAFIDDSGSDPTGRVFMLAGYVATAEQWNRFSVGWDAACVKSPVISDFKMAEAWRLNGIYWRSYPPEEREVKRDERLLELAHVVRNNVTCAFSVGMPWCAYETVARGRIPSSVDDPYFFLFWRILQLVTQWQQQTARHEKVDFIFDDQSKLGNSTASWHSAFLESMTDDERFILTGTPIFKHDNEMLALKAADMWAWSCRREVIEIDRVGRTAYNRHPAAAVLFQCPYVSAVITEAYLRGLIDKLTTE